MLLWGGHGPGFNNHCGDGTRYDPATDSWSVMSMKGSPSPRLHHGAVWTGRELLVWGGANGEDEQIPDGGIYDPGTDSWRAIPAFQIDGQAAGRRSPGVVWTGSEMLVWGGADEENDLADGAAFDPATGKWRAIGSDGQPVRRHNHCAFWTGDQMLVWGGFANNRAGGDGTGGLYDPATDIWSPIPLDGAAKPRTNFAAAWTGTELVVWGGYKGGKTFPADGGIFDPTKGLWRPIKRSKQAPGKRALPASVWTGQELLLWGGSAEGGFLDDGGLYNPTSGQWTPIPGDSRPGPRLEHSIVWTGDEAIVWGGRSDQNSLHNTGGRFRPSS